MIDDKVLIPIGLAIGAIGGAAVWMTTVWVELGSASSSISEIRVNQKEYTENLNEIRRDIAEIKAELKARK